MKHDTIEINGTPYRVEFNWNAISNFLEEEDLALNSIDDLTTLKPSQITRFIFEAVKEGSRMQGVDFNFDVKEFGAAIGIAEVGKLLVVFQRQSTAGNKAEKTKKKTWFNPKKSV